MAIKYIQIFLALIDHAGILLEPIDLCLNSTNAVVPRTDVRVKFTDLGIDGSDLFVNLRDLIDSFIDSKNLILDLYKSISNFLLLVCTIIKGFILEVMVDTLSTGRTTIIIMIEVNFLPKATDLVFKLVFQLYQLSEFGIHLLGISDLIQHFFELIVLTSQCHFCEQNLTHEFVNQLLFLFDEMIVVRLQRVDMLLSQLDLVLDQVDLIVGICDGSLVGSDFLFEKVVHCGKDLDIQKILNDLTASMCRQLHERKIIGTAQDDNLAKTLET